MMTSGIIGFISNIVFAFLVIRINFGSVQTTTILLLQFILDGWTCGSTFVMKLLEEAAQGQKLNHTDAFCKLVYGDQLMWFGAIGSIQNIVCISFDRFFAVFYPLVYSNHKISFILVCISYVLLMTCFILLPQLFGRKAIDGKCVSAILSNTVLFAIDSVSYFILAYLLPVLIFILIHILIIMKVKERSRTEQDSTDCNCQADAKCKHLDEETVRLTKTLTIIPTFLLATHFYDTICYLLSGTSRAEYLLYSTRQQVGVLFVILSSALFPFVVLATTKTLRNNVQAMFKNCFRRRITG